MTKTVETKNWEIGALVTCEEYHMIITALKAKQKLEPENEKLKSLIEDLDEADY